MGNSMLNLYNSRNQYDPTKPANSVPYELPAMGEVPLSTRTLPNGGGTYNPSPQPGGQIINPVQPPAPVAPAPVGKFYDKYKDPKTGKVMNPTEYANFLASKIPKGTGEVGNYAGDAMTNPNQSANDLRSRATNLNNSRNDIAVGESDPYKAGSQSGIAYSPTELKAIESAYAGIYDPVLNDVFSRLADKEKSDKEEQDRKNMLEEKAIEHDYRMSERVAPAASKGPNSYQEWTLAGGEAGTGMTYADYLKGGKGGSSFKSDIAITGREAVTNMLGIANESPGIFGRTASMWVPDSGRTDAFRNYEAQLDALKGNIIPAALTAMREASDTGGALGQVSDREGAWLAASLGALSMSQSSAQVVSQLKQVDAHLKEWQDAVEADAAEKGAPAQPASGADRPATMILNGQTLQLQADGTYN